MGNISYRNALLFVASGSNSLFIKDPAFLRFCVSLLSFYGQAAYAANAL
jgi:hypothetical protein